MCLYSVVVPVYNSEHTLQELYTRLEKVFRETIKEEFELGVYIGKNEIKNRIQQVYNEHSIGYKVTQDTIKDYYYLKESNSKGVASFKLEVFKFE